MNLFEFYQELSFIEQMNWEFLVVDRIVECYYCGVVAESGFAYSGAQAQHAFWNMHSAEVEELREVNVAFSHKIKDGYYLISTTRNRCTYHCHKCTLAPVAIAADLETQMRAWAHEAAELVTQELGFDFMIRFYNQRAGEGGFVKYAHAHLININLGYWIDCRDIRGSIMEATAHEARHLWQFRNGWKQSGITVPYLERAEEIDAFGYAAEFRQKYCTNILV